MPSRWTFTIKPIKELLSREVFNNKLWCDPFAGLNSPAKITNDLNPDMNAMSHMDALDFLKSIKNNSLDGVLYDPPYSPRQASECYKSVGLDKFTNNVTRCDYWSKCKNEIARILKTNGKAICFGWNSMGIGKTRGFKMTEVLLIPHGGSINDTIVTVEYKK